MVCKEEACLDDLHGCGQPFNLKKHVIVALGAYD